MTLKLSKDAAWAKVTKFVALKGMTTSVADKESGVITASGTTIKGQIIDCDTKGGAFDKCEYKLSISVDSFAESASVVSVRLSGEVTQSLRKHVGPVPTSTVKTAIACFSNGSFEKELFEYLK